MAGGYLNLISGGPENIIMYGNPQKSLWTSTYKQISNFGLQNFRLDYEGLRQLQTTSDTLYKFHIKAYAELLSTMYLTIQLPDIFSPLYVDSQDVNHPYEFRWIKNLGAMLIRSVRITIGGSIIQEISGNDIVALANRDLNDSQKAKWDAMTGNVPELYDPAYYRGGYYPNAIYQDTACQGVEPSIRGRQLRIPIPTWWCQNASQALPLVCIHNNEIYADITLRPLRDLYQIRNSLGTLVAPDWSNTLHHINQFLYEPTIDGVVPSTSSSWFENLHLSCTYCFLSPAESISFARLPQTYLIRELHDTWFRGITSSERAWLQNSSGLVIDWMFLFQRSDVNERNEWSNYTNWKYDYIPSNITPTDLVDEVGDKIYQSGPFAFENVKDILLTLGILFDGTIREEIRSANIYKYEQQFLACPGQGSASLSGLYAYNCCLNTSPYIVQPTGAINVSKYSKIEVAFTTIEPPLNPVPHEDVICDLITNSQLGVSKQKSDMYDFTYDLLVIEERFNTITFRGGNAQLMNIR